MIGDGLHAYLVKYVIRYFDHDFERNHRFAEAARQFGRRQFHGAVRPRATGMTAEDACRHLGICTEELAAMDRAELIRRYRAHAKSVHPDAGGDHEGFIRMAEAYELLLAGKPA